MRAVGRVEHDETLLTIGGKKEISMKRCNCCGEAFEPAPRMASLFCLETSDLENRIAELEASLAPADNVVPLRSVK
jgi:hypothetical protein